MIARRLDSTTLTQKDSPTTQVCVFAMKRYFSALLPPILLFCSLTATFTTHLLALSSASYSSSLEFLSTCGETKESIVNDTGSHIVGSSRTDNNKPKILVVYTGPASKDEPKIALYQRNFEYFMKNGGVDCAAQDTVAVVGHDFYDQYVDQVEAMDRQCQEQYGNRFVLVARRAICYDMESVFMAMYGGLAGFNIKHYDYLM